jgi:hypothetical protein
MDATGTTTPTKYYYKNTGTQAAQSFTLQSGGGNIFDVTTVTALRLTSTCFGADSEGDIDCMFVRHTNWHRRVHQERWYQHFTCIHACDIDCAGLPMEHGRTS